MIEQLDELIRKLFQNGNDKYGPEIKQITHNLLHRCS